MEFFSQVNLVDLLAVVTLGWCIYGGIQQGVIVEFFKLLGIWGATLVSLHYYPSFGVLLHKMVGSPWGVSELVAFSILWGLVVVTFKFVRDGWLLILKPRSNYPFLNKWVGAILGIGRAFLTIGLIFIFIFLGGNQFFSRQALKSFSAEFLIDISPHIYGSCFDGFVANLFPHETKNEDVFKLARLAAKYLPE